MSIWTAIDRPDYRDNKLSYDIKEYHEQLRETNNLSNYNPVIDKFYSNR